MRIKFRANYIRYSHALLTKNYGASLVPIEITWPIAYGSSILQLQSFLENIRND